MAKYYSVFVNTPLEACDKVRLAIGQTGAGKVGNYGFCSFSYKGVGRSLPMAGANPAIGTVGKLEVINEERIETFCVPEDLEKVIRAIRSSHPYEEPAIAYFPIELV